jgi:cytochrome c556
MEPGAPAGSAPSVLKQKTRLLQEDTMKDWIMGGLVVGVSLTAGMALAQRPSPDQMANGYRQSLMTVIAGNMGPMGAMAQDRMPFNAALVEKNSERIAFLAGMISDAFNRDTRSAELETDALPGIWANMADFSERATELRSRAEALLTAARGGDEAATKAAIGRVGQACGGCHDEYRAED